MSVALPNYRYRPELIVSRTRRGTTIRVISEATMDPDLRVIARISASISLLRDIGPR
jgi:hypothetical protein